MLFNTSYENRTYDKERDKQLGKAFPFFEKIKMGGIGSGKLSIYEISHHLKPENMVLSDTSFANIEIRPKGIIIHFANKLEEYSWLIPYYRLVVYSTENFTIHANGHFIQFKKNKHYSSNKKFINKMMDLKNIFSNESYYGS